ncbi:hypothetical protein AMTR_s00065p00138660 [Amborella trichopoda]|uniref:Uncharacterized protein n=1 Tax=Amborella trichopoda TaxID=13333 RepID=U5D8R0_AMBTC|nr:hypothetical protein AMTR_s00065p00138660 [Amborella trichopoda]
MEDSQEGNGEKRSLYALRQRGLILEYLKKSEENKARNDKERLDSYYKRNYKDYFELFEGPIKDKKEGLSEVEKGIQEWLKANK